MRKIKNLDDLKAAIALPSWFETVQDMNAWLPELAASLSWQTRLSPHFLLHYYDDNPQGAKDNLGDTFAGTLEQIYTQLEQFLQIIPQSKQEKLASQTRLIWFILQTRTGRTFGSLTDPYVLFYLMDIRQDPDYKQRFRHEMAHMMWSRLYGEAPSLFQEGVAVYAEYGSAPEASFEDHLHAKAIDVNQVPPLSEIAITENFWQHQHQPMYLVSGLWIHFLVERWGWDKLKHLFLLSEYEDPNIIDHFHQVYGQTLEEADLAWRRHLRSGGKHRN